MTVPAVEVTVAERETTWLLALYGAVALDAVVVVAAAFTVRLAAFEVAVWVPPQVLVNTAWY